MINQVYQLVSPRQFEATFKTIDLHNHNSKVIVRPLYLSICAADLRYYCGNRDSKILSKKLPMSLIHESVGEIVYDSEHRLKNGTKVVMIPNTPSKSHNIIAENYLTSSHFKSSGYDGFMQDYIVMKPDRVVTLPQEIDLSVASYTELVTVSVHAIDRFKAKAIPQFESLGIWGDGNLGYITAVLLKKLYPTTKIIVFGKTLYKLSRFSFVDEIIQIDNIPQHIKIDHAFECVGGKGSQQAIEQIINIINPEGSIALLGVSELSIQVNTRMVLEKGLTIIGSSRSGLKDFEKTIELYRKYPEVLNQLALLKGKEFEINTIEDLITAFEYDISNAWGKTVLKWNI
ncbi:MULTISPECIES: alcohol dehydrogenase catalytic domain-containing protein [Staphylococcus]|uniref:Ribulose-5-phosphate reductase n=4 Tax=Staphylococcus epidermidis TaxID=1282 RepID=Q5HRJ6_STAEQ|nr:MULTISPECIES: alcohol dehydrogenase catalytic domain-containing protein [Staphylococcus]EHM72937.1 GroES-like protein [Staphylococcus epidermidis 14.1.R1.SE]MDU7764168.1 alcohol dehydrogenase catalytic domain-containing protein [Staphylococcus sp.]MEB2860633.1 alcohol dehydrogenase catalytic domain-containing protein [Staphylococcus sp. GCP4]AAW53610.1 alcohol dehydrogenase, zinc-containing [Staphylococcus epidermidis RP62A]APT17227.1 ribitol-5-phosphate dehydrogenase [Staphylococcus epider